MHAFDHSKCSGHIALEVDEEYQPAMCQRTPSSNLSKPLAEITSQGRSMHSGMAEWAVVAGPRWRLSENVHCSLYDSFSSSPKSRLL